MQDSKSLDKLIVLKDIANNFIVSGGMKDMKKVKIQLTWKQLGGDFEDDEVMVLPCVDIELERMP